MVDLICTLIRRKGLQKCSWHSFKKMQDQLCLDNMLHRKYDLFVNLCNFLDKLALSPNSVRRRVLCNLKLLTQPDTTCHTNKKPYGPSSFESSISFEPRSNHFENLYTCSWEQAPLNTIWLTSEWTHRRFCCKIHRSAKRHIPHQLCLITSGNELESNQCICNIII